MLLLHFCSVLTNEYLSKTITYNQSILGHKTNLNTLVVCRQRYIHTNLYKLSLSHTHTHIHTGEP